MDLLKRYPYYFIYQKDCQWCIKILLLLRKLKTLEQQIMCIDSDQVDIKDVEFVPAFIDITEENSEPHQSLNAFMWLMKKINQYANTETDPRISDIYLKAVKDIRLVIDNYMNINKKHSSAEKINTIPKNRFRSNISSPKKKNNYSSEDDTNLSNIRGTKRGNNKFGNINKINNHNLKDYEGLRNSNPINISGTGQLDSYINQIVQERDSVWTDAPSNAGAPLFTRTKNKAGDIGIGQLESHFKN